MISRFATALSPGGGTCSPYKLNNTYKKEYLRFMFNKFEISFQENQNTSFFERIDCNRL